jgi:hypothetical protein
MSVAGIMVLAECEDVLALRVIRAVQRRGAAVEILTPAQLALGCAWAHRVNTGGVSTDIVIDGRPIAPPSAVFHRLSGVRFFPAAVWRNAGDAAYAEGELAALIVSWLASLDAIVLGPPNTGILHYQPGLVEWMTLAAQADLPVRRLTWTTDAHVVAREHAVLLDPFDPDRHLTDVEARFIGRRPVIAAEPLRELTPVFVVGDRVIDAPDATLEPGLARLSALSGCNLLACRVGQTDDPERRWVFSGASVAFREAPESVVSAIADALVRRHEAT